MKKVYDLVKNHEKDKDKKARWKNHGAVIQNDKGNLTLVLDTIHGTEYFNLFEPKPYVNKETPKTQPIDTDDIDDIIPF